MTTKLNRLERLKKLQNMAISSRLDRSIKIQIALLEELIRGQLDKTLQGEEPDLYLLEMYQADRDIKLEALKEEKKNVYIGTVYAGEIWGVQRLYLKTKEPGKIYVYVENLPSGWALSQVVNKTELCLDGGTGWMAKVTPGSWDLARKLMNNLKTA